ncbi:MAG: secretion protein HlyD [endosymbiont of Galathealinum brachiosum]|uniref:Secretion protein HlyD n=1 Tax=endosymbiont of Galathealinum brachiosum TaxID=2200906 RepID=A0A370DHW9_9GAMM|nr:MAG: secretion protein HlyD [endosymbiont of Galathealinum brachiosum]
MNTFLKRPVIKNSGIQLLTILLMSILLAACDNTNSEQHSSKHNTHGTTSEVEVVKGPHGGRLLTSGDFTLELSIFETGVPPEFRAWASLKDKLLTPDEIDLNITLTRLSNNEEGKIDEIKFITHGDALRGDSVIYEPHSFIVTINATHNGIRHNWQYDNFEGRTKIETAVAKALEIKTDIAGPVLLQETINVFGQINANTERVSQLGARFAGIIKSVSASMGDTVRKGQTLATIESNESLNLYTIKAPISGVITSRNANPGERTNDQVLFTITDTSSVWVDLAIFPGDVSRVKMGATVSFKLANNTQTAQGKITFINVITQTNQSVTARMVIDNKDGKFLPGSYVKAKIKVGEHAVPLAVKRSGLQAFRDFTVVYAKVGEEYEVRMLELGRQDDEWIEVLGGLHAGTHYVSENSYVIKADIEKSGASHDH